jgi:hypothetical protein
MLSSRFFFCHIYLLFNILSYIILFMEKLFQYVNYSLINFYIKRKIIKVSFRQYFQMIMTIEKIRIIMIVHHFGLEIGSR